jgi:hypothetical protein
VPTGQLAQPAGEIHLLVLGQMLATDEQDLVLDKRGPQARKIVVIEVAQARPAYVGADYRGQGLDR